MRCVTQVLVRQTQKSLPLDAARLEATLRVLLRAAGCSHMDIGVWLTTDSSVKR